MSDVSVGFGGIDITPRDGARRPSRRVFVASFWTLSTSAGACFGMAAMLLLPHAIEVFVGLVCLAIAAVSALVLWALHDEIPA